MTFSPLGESRWKRLARPAHGEHDMHLFALEAHAVHRPSPQREALGTLRARAPALLPQYRRLKETRAAPSWQRLHSAGAPSEDDEVIHGKIKHVRSVLAIPERSRGCPTGCCDTRRGFLRRENQDRQTLR